MNFGLHSQRGADLLHLEPLACKAFGINNREIHMHSAQGSWSMCASCFGAHRLCARKVISYYIPTEPLFKDVAYMNGLNSKVCSMMFHQPPGIVVFGDHLVPPRNHRSIRAPILRWMGWA